MKRKTIIRLKRYMNEGVKPRILEKRLKYIDRYVDLYPSGAFIGPDGFYDENSRYDGEWPSIIPRGGRYRISWHLHKDVIKYADWWYYIVPPMDQVKTANEDDIAVGIDRDCYVTSNRNATKAPESFVYIMARVYSAKERRISEARTRKVIAEINKLNGEELVGLFREYMKQREPCALSVSERVLEDIVSWYDQEADGAYAGNMDEDIEFVAIGEFGEWFWRRMKDSWSSSYEGWDV